MPAGVYSPASPSRQWVHRFPSLLLHFCSGIQLDTRFTQKWIYKRSCVLASACPLGHKEITTTTTTEHKPRAAGKEVINPRLIRRCLFGYRSLAASWKGFTDAAATGRTSCLTQANKATVRRAFQSQYIDSAELIKILRDFSVAVMVMMRFFIPFPVRNPIVYVRKKSFVV